MKPLVGCIALLAMMACSSRAGVEVENAWARATPPGATVGVVYAQLESAQADEILAVESPAAERVEMHATLEEGGMMKMRPVATVALPAREPVKFAAGGLHLMLIGLREPLIPGASISLTFTFRAAPPVTIEAAVAAP